jgi:hypothetical protein
MNIESADNKVILKKFSDFGQIFTKIPFVYWPVAPLTQYRGSKRFQTVMSGFSEHSALGVDCECKSLGKASPRVIQS